MLCARKRTVTDKKLKKISQEELFVYEEFISSFMNWIKSNSELERWKMQLVIESLHTVVKQATTKGFSGVVPDPPGRIYMNSFDDSPGTDDEEDVVDDVVENLYSTRPVTENERLELATYAENILQNVLSREDLFTEDYVERRGRYLVSLMNRKL